MKFIKASSFQKFHTGRFNIKRYYKENSHIPTRIYIYFKKVL